MTKRHPYVGIAKRQLWKEDPGIRDPRLFDPVSEVSFQIGVEDRVVTAGSCFAQHVARHLSGSGFNHLITEPAHGIFSAALAQKFGYGLFSARYGNIYTTRQLLQLLHRAYGLFEPAAKSWPRGTEGRVVDPFRPQIQPEGFVSEAELLADREQHFAAIRSAIETMDIFVFTLGLTECWEDARDGAIFPLAPGVAGGTYDPEQVNFRNFDERETADDLIAALRFIRERNPDVKIILTVSPVPLNATFENRHVFVSTTWSKAVLRIAAEKAAKAFDRCCYFPSYEIITAPHVRGSYFAEDCREVLKAGVDHVMRLFFLHFAGVTEKAASADAKPAEPNAAQRHVQSMERDLEVLCDEEAISDT